MDADTLEMLPAVRPARGARAKRDKVVNTGRHEVINGFKSFEVILNGRSSWIPCEPDKAYGAKWKGWSDFLGLDNKGMTK